MVFYVRLQCMHCSIHKFPKLLYPVKTAFAVMYSLCGYVILYGSCFTPWMDIVALFPLLMLALDRLLTTGKKLFYIVMVALSFIINYYLSAMALIYVFFSQRCLYFTAV